MKVTSMFLAAVLAVFCTVANAAINFQASPQQASVAENVAIATSLLQVTAITDTGNPVTYSIAAQDGSPTSIVNIDANTGLITLGTPLDYETTTQLLFSVSAEDTVAIVPVIVIFTLDVTDVNDNIPAFSAGSYSGMVVQFGTFFTPVTVTATDADSGLNAQISYQIASAGNLEGNFQIDSSTGVISMIKTVDNPQSHATFSLSVWASDAGTPSLTSTSSVTVTITIDTTAYSCPGWMDKYGAKCYKHVRGLKTYAKAQANCEFLGTKSGLGSGTLATIYDGFRQTFVVNTLMLPRSRNSVWIGLNDKGIEGTWVWEDSSSYSYANWATQNSVQQPAGGNNQNCVAIESRHRLGKWNDFRCAMKTWSVCHFPATVV